MSQLVPPMSKPSAGGSPTMRAATAPPAGPESSIAAGWAAACSSVATPPEESITCGSGRPAASAAWRRRARYLRVGGPSAASTVAVVARSNSRTSAATSCEATTNASGSAARSSSATRASCAGSRNANRRHTATASTRARASRRAARSTLASSSGLITSCGPIRSSTSTHRPRSTTGDVGASCSRYRLGRAWRPRKSRSRKPFVVTSAVRARRRSSRALVATVDPCTKCATSPGATPARSSTSRAASTTPSSWLRVLRTLAVTIPSRPTSTASVNVPPTSTPSALTRSPPGPPRRRAGRRSLCRGPRDRPGSCWRARARGPGSGAAGSARGSRP